LKALSTAQIEDDIVEEAVHDGLANFQEASKLSFSSPANPSNIKIGGVGMNHQGLRVRRGVMTVLGYEAKHPIQRNEEDIEPSCTVVPTWRNSSYPQCKKSLPRSESELEQIESRYG
jgi:hypothetical protein